MTLILASTVTTFSFYVLFDGSYVSATLKCQLNNSLFIFYALLDIFMSYNMFFLLEENNRPDIIRCENLDTTYTMLDVIQTDVSISCLEDDSDSSES